VIYIWDGAGLQQPWSAPVPTAQTARACAAAQANNQMLGMSPQVDSRPHRVNQTWTRSNPVDPVLTKKADLDRGGPYRVLLELNADGDPFRSQYRLSIVETDDLDDIFVRRKCSPSWSLNVSEYSHIFADLGFLDDFLAPDRTFIAANRDWKRFSLSWYLKKPER
jgi:hypothetical protein